MPSNNLLNRLRTSSYSKYALCILSGLALGWMLAPSSKGSAAEGEGHQHEHASTEVWTCSMHPQIKQDKPGKCPICAMDLTPLRSASAHAEGAIPEDAIQLSPEAMALADVQTIIASRQTAERETRLYGTIQADERLTRAQTSHISGRIERLMVNFTGESVQAGQTIASVYSPELLTAQQELLEAKRLAPQHPELLEAARTKLRGWKMTDEQIDRIEQTGIPSPIIEVKAGSGGIVVERKVSQGDYVSQGSVLFELANLSQVWAMFEAYEGDLPFLKVGDRVDFTLDAAPGEAFSGKISFVDPILDRNTRTSRIRVEVANPQGKLKPEMYATGIIRSRLQGEAQGSIVVPRSSVLWTGKRSLVYVQLPQVDAPTFVLREVELGERLGESYIIRSGLQEGERIVSQGVFAIDASAQLEGKPSMMNLPPTASDGAQDPSSHQHASPSEASTEVILKVQGNCEMCRERIETAAKAIKGVRSASWDGETKELRLQLGKDPSILEAVSRSVAASGHDTQRHKAPQSVYDALPGCCLYRN